MSLSGASDLTEGNRGESAAVSLRESLGRRRPPEHASWPMASHHPPVGEKTPGPASRIKKPAHRLPLRHHPGSKK